MRVVLMAVMLAGCAQVHSPDELTRRACTAEGMWCQDAQHSRCCRGLKCVESKCVRREGKQGEQLESL